MISGMSWALINMVPYLIVVIYCWYRVRIPGLVCACFRNIQLLLRAVCGVLILIQAYTTRNLTEKFICPHEYSAEIGRSPLTMVRDNIFTSQNQKPKNPAIQNNNNVNPKRLTHSIIELNSAKNRKISRFSEE